MIFSIILTAILLLAFILAPYWSYRAGYKDGRQDGRRFAVEQYLIRSRAGYETARIAAEWQDERDRMFDRTMANTEADEEWQERQIAE